MSSTIDWMGQLEAYHEDGRVTPVVFREDDGTDDLPILLDLPNEHVIGFWARRDGKIDCTGWIVRNAPQTPSQAPQATSTLRTKDEALDRFEALLGRLEAILGGMSKGEVK